MCFVSDSLMSTSQHTHIDGDECQTILPSYADGYNILRPSDYIFPPPETKHNPDYYYQFFLERSVFFINWWRPFVRDTSSDNWPEKTLTIRPDATVEPVYSDTSFQTWYYESTSYKSSSVLPTGDTMHHTISHASPTLQVVISTTYADSSTVDQRFTSDFSKTDSGIKDNTHSTVMPATSTLSGHMTAGDRTYPTTRSVWQEEYDSLTTRHISKTSREELTHDVSEMSYTETYQWTARFDSFATTDGSLISDMGSSVSTFFTGGPTGSSFGIQSSKTSNSNSENSDLSSASVTRASGDSDGDYSTSIDVDSTQYWMISHSLRISETNMILLETKNTESETISTGNHYSDLETLVSFYKSDEADDANTGINTYSITAEYTNTEPVSISSNSGYGTLTQTSNALLSGETHISAEADTVSIKNTVSGETSYVATEMLQPSSIDDSKETEIMTVSELIESTPAWYSETSVYNYSQTTLKCSISSGRPIIPTSIFHRESEVLKTASDFEYEQSTPPLSLLSFGSTVSSESIENVWPASSIIDFTSSTSDLSFIASSQTNTNRQDTGSEVVSHTNTIDSTTSTPMLSTANKIDTSSRIKRVSESFADTITETHATEASTQVLQTSILSENCGTSLTTWTLSTMSTQSWEIPNSGDAYSIKTITHTEGLDLETTSSKQTGGIYESMLTPTDGFVFASSSYTTLYPSDGLPLSSPSKSLLSSIGSPYTRSLPAISATSPVYSLDTTRSFVAFTTKSRSSSSLSSELFFYSGVVLTTETDLSITSSMTSNTISGALDAVSIDLSTLTGTYVEVYSSASSTTLETMPSTASLMSSNTISGDVEAVSSESLTLIGTSIVVNYSDSPTTLEIMPTTASSMSSMSTASVDTSTSSATPNTTPTTPLIATTPMSGGSDSQSGIEYVHTCINITPSLIE